MEFTHKEIKYYAKIHYLCSLYQIIPGRAEPAWLFTIKKDDDITEGILIAEIENRAAQRLSALQGTFRLDPARTAPAPVEINAPAALTTDNHIVCKKPLMRRLMLAKKTNRRENKK